MADELATADTWLFETLSADATLTGLLAGGIHKHPAPQNTAHPLVTIQYLGGADLMVVGAVRIWHNGVWLIRGIISNQQDVYDQAVVSDISDRIDTVLHRQSGTPSSGGNVWSAIREQPYELDETDEGVRYLHRGGQFRLKVTA